MNLFYQPLLKRGANSLDPEEARHCFKVLRKKPGDTIQITDGLGVMVEGVITAIQKDSCTFKIISEAEVPQKKYAVHIAIAPTKNQDRIEWFVEKAVEIGVDKISFIQCQHSEKGKLKMERIHKLALSAMKQSLKAYLPVITPPLSFSDFIIQKTEEERFIAHVDFDNPLHLIQTEAKNKATCVAIGPEGDFSSAELSQALQAGFKKISLGSSRLRTETAGVAACHILNLMNL